MDGITVSLGIGIAGVVITAPTSCSGVEDNRVRSAFIGVEVMEWREADRSRVKEGPIGVQLHFWNGPQEVLYKDIMVETFPKVDRLITVKR